MALKESLLRYVVGYLPWLAVLLLHRLHKLVTDKARLYIFCANRCNCFPLFIPELIFVDAQISRNFAGSYHLKVGLHLSNIHTYDNVVVP